MSGLADTDTGMESPDFDRWGSEIEGPPERRPGPGNARSLSPLNLAGIVIVVAALVALIVHLTAGGRAPGPAANPTSPSAVAAAINLRVSDLAGFHAGSSGGVSVGGDPDSALRECFGTGAGAVAPPTASFRSPDFVSGAGLQFVSLGSTVGFSTATALASERVLAADPRFPPCLANALAALTYRVHGLAITSGGGAQATPLPLPPARGGAVHTLLGVRASMTWSVNGLNFPAFVDLYVATLGKEELSLFALSSEQPYSIATEDRLVALLETRAQRHPH